LRSSPPKCFQKESAITRTPETPTFFDAIWPDNWPKITDKLYSDLSKGTRDTALGRCSIARHPEKPEKAVSGQRVPGAINMGFADGHASEWKLQEIKNVVGPVGYTPNADPWATAP